MSASDEEYDSSDSPVREEEGNNTIDEEDDMTDKKASGQSSDESYSGESEGEPDEISHSPVSPVGEEEREELSPREEDEAREESVHSAEEKEAANVSDPFDDEAIEGEEGDEDMTSAVALASAQASKFMRESDSEEEEGEGERQQLKEGAEEESEEQVKERDGEDGQPLEQESDAEDDTPEVGGVEGVAEEGLGQQSDEEELPPSKKIKTDTEVVDTGSGGEGSGGEAGEGSDAGEGAVEEEVSELQQEVAELDEGEGGSNDVSETAVGVANLGEEEEGSEDEIEDDRNKEEIGMSDWDLMMQKRKAAMARARKRRRKDIDINASDEFVEQLIRGMKIAAEEDKQLNLAGKAATKKLQMLPTIMQHLKNGDLQTAFIECGILTALAEWLTPLPDHSLPHLKIRTSILDTLTTFPTPGSSLLKISKIGKAVMLLYRHPKEARRNREKAGKLVNEWARPIFGVASDLKSLSRDKREERDYAHLSQAARRRLSSSGERRASQDEEFQPQKPGDKGWVGRARVPMPSTRDYVVRPKWNAEQEFKRGPTKKVLNRYEEHLRKKKTAKQQSKATHAVSISIEGRHMPL